MKPMTETEWFTCSDPVQMLKHLRGRASHRKLRLFAVACCRRIWHLLEDETSRAAVEVAERRAEGEASEEDLAEASASARHPLDSSRSLQATPAAYAAYVAASPYAPYAARQVAQCAAVRNGFSQSGSCALLRDVFGNPFHSAVMEPSWLAWNDGTIPKIAQAIYTERRFGDMPILADALEEAGCDNADVLLHCRLDGEHVRGCWLVDLLLGKS